MTRIPKPAKAALQAGKQFLKRFFSGKLTSGSNVPIGWQGLSPFEARVLKALRKVAPSQVTHYGALAKSSGVPNGARAVGNALGRNPLPVLIPCHRVVRKDQSLGGFSGGLNWKRRLLKLERVPVKKNH
jgi:methylated-DNA-[protein]-cysteine S-methyltransferase